MKLRFLIPGACTLAVVCGSTALAQRPRISDPPSNNLPTKGAQGPGVADPNAPATPPVSVPESIKVKYEGGYFGYNQKVDGTLHIDHMNEKLIFRSKENRELFNVPYSAVMAAFGDTQSRRPAAASVIGSAVPYGLGLPALFIKKKYRYLNLQYNDVDTEVAGMLNFKFENEQTLADWLQAIAAETGLTQRGEVYVRKRKPVGTTDSIVVPINPGP